MQRLKLFRDFNLRHLSLGNGQFFYDRNIAGGRNASAILAVLAIAEVLSTVISSNSTV